MKSWWTALHFIQPRWLWLLLAVPLIYLSFRIHHDVRARWKRYIDPDLLDHLIVAPKRRYRLRPIHMICLLIALGGNRKRPPRTSTKESTGKPSFLEQSDDEELTQHTNALTSNLFAKVPSGSWNGQVMANHLRRHRKLSFAPASARSTAIAQPE